MEVREIYRLLGRSAQHYQRAHESSMESRWEVSKEGFFETMKPRHKAHSECRRGRGLTFQAGDRAHLGHFKNFYRAGM